jgi:hypothetical protein
MALIHQQIGVIIALILLVIAIYLFGVPLAARLRKILRGKRHDSSPSPSHNPSQRGSRMLPRRQDSQETLLDELVNVGDDKVDGALSLFIFRPPQWLTRLHKINSHSTGPLPHCAALLE